MTRKDYVLIATTIAQAFYLSESQKETLAKDFADQLSLENPRFIRERFLVASGVFKKCDYCQNQATTFASNFRWCGFHKGRGLVKDWSPIWSLTN